MYKKSLPDPSKLRLVGDEGSIFYPGENNFVAYDKFARRSKEWPSNFVRWFENVKYDSVPPSMIHFGRLDQSSTTKGIIRALGGEKRAEMSLAEVFFIASLSRWKESNCLLLNEGRETPNWSNIFFVRDVDGILRCVSTIYSFEESRWILFADEVKKAEYSYGSFIKWRDGHRVFYRKSV